MQRFTTPLRLRALRPSPTAAVARATPTQLLASLRHNASTSAPKSAEGASAESGGSRSKSASAAGADDDTSSHTTAEPGGVPDSLADGSDMRGRTGGGKPLESSRSAPWPPKVWNHNVAGGEPGKDLTGEQREEVESHNAEFERKHDRANKAEDDRVDKSFWGDREAGSKQ